MVIKNTSSVLVVIIATLLFSCKKNDSGSNNTFSDAVAVDSAWFFAQNVYLWYKNLPANIDTKSYADPNALMVDIRKYSIEPGFTDPVDRWSFAIKKTKWDDISSGISGDFGLNIFFMTASDLRVSYVEPNSPAGGAGIKRSWQIKSINGNTNIATDDATINRITNAIYSASSATIVFGRTGAADTTISLTARSYQEQPIYLDTIYAINGKKTGYLVYNSFLGDVTNIKSRFASLFTKFNSQGMTDLIIDLRYNGGGYVALQNELANYLVPTAGNADVMLKELFNDKLSATEDSTIYYAKKGALNLNRIFFITTKNTASASELLINSLKPYMEVKLVGRATHGKAVGYFNISDQDWYIFPVSFRTVNKNNEGNYFNGLAPDATVSDGLDKDWGDITENCLASALHYINEGSFSNISPRKESNNQLDDQNLRLDTKRFRGAVEKWRK